MSKNKDLEYINEFKKITLNQICKDLYLNSSNLYRGNMDKYHIHKIRIELENRLNKLNEKPVSRKIKSKKRRIKKKYRK